jgi:hypothetical protein
VKEQLERILDSIATLDDLHSSPVDVGATPDRVDLTALTPELDRLADLLRNDDFDAQGHVDALLPRVRGTALEAGLGEIARHLSSYDFEAALEALDQLRTS